MQLMRPSDDAALGLSDAASASVLLLAGVPAASVSASQSLDICTQGRLNQLEYDSNAHLPFDGIRQKVCTTRSACCNDSTAARAQAPETNIKPLKPGQAARVQQRPAAGRTARRRQPPAWATAPGAPPPAAARPAP